MIRPTNHPITDFQGCGIEASIQQRLHELGEKVEYIHKVSFALSKCSFLTRVDRSNLLREMTLQSTLTRGEILFPHSLRVLLTHIASYSFADNQYMHITNLAKILYTKGITQVVVTGLATDYCVKATAIDARKFGFETLVVRDAMRAVDPSSEDRVFGEMERWGCRAVTAAEIYS